MSYCRNDTESFKSLNMFRPANYLSKNDFKKMQVIMNECPETAKS